MIFYNTNSIKFKRTLKKKEMHCAPYTCANQTVFKVQKRLMVLDIYTRKIIKLKNHCQNNHEGPPFCTYYYILLLLLFEHTYT